MHSNVMESILVNAPIKVNFAGLRGNTMDMQNNGWQLNVQVERSYQYHGYMVRLAGKHTGLNLRFYSGVATLDIGALYSNNDLRSWYNTMEFPIAASNIAKNIMLPMPVGNTTQSFSIDFSNPYLIDAPVSRLMNLDEVFFFQGFDEEKSLYLPDELILSTQEYLDKVLEGQKDKQKELREKARKKEYRLEGAECGEEIFNTNLSKRDIKLQLIGV